MMPISARWRRVALAALVASLVMLNLYQYARWSIWQQADASPSRIINRFHRLFYDTPTTWARNQWFGVLTQQNPNDVWIIQEIISEVRPDVIVETGTLYGGSAVLWATILQQVNPEGRVITIDIEDNVTAARALPMFKAKVDFLVGSSTSPAIVAEVKERVQNRKVLVVLDSNHSKSHVLDELKAYSPLIGAGGYLIVQDTNVNGHPVLREHGPGPMEAVDEFLRTNPDFAPDHTRERLLFTMHPRGFLRRLR